MDLNVILAEADVLVPNDVPTADKVMFLNYLNQDFFNVVKIPTQVYFAPVKNVSTYALPIDIRQKNIDFVSVGVVKYAPLNERTPNPLQNTFTFNDLDHTLTLSPPPYQDGLQGVVRYKMLATAFLSPSNLSAQPLVPEEFHWTLVNGLASYLANTQDDAVKASNYENQYKSAWNVAAQNYAKGEIV